MKYLNIFKKVESYEYCDFFCKDRLVDANLIYIMTCSLKLDVQIVIFRISNLTVLSLLNKVPRLPRVPKSSSSARVSKCLSTHVPSALNSRVSTYPTSSQVSQVLECPWIPECPWSDLRLSLEWLLSTQYFPKSWKLQIL